MAFLVHIFNNDSGWKVGEYLSSAETEAEALKEAAQHYGTEGLTQFRSFAHEIVEANEAPLAVEGAATVEPEPAETEAPAPSALNTPSVEAPADATSELKALVAKLASLLGG